MSEKSNKAKISFILEMIENIEKIIIRHKTVSEALEDYEGQMAIMMGISQIGETIKKLEDEIIEKYNLKNDKEGAYYTRNYIVHNYVGVDLGFIKNILIEYIPKLKKKILDMD